MKEYWVNVYKSTVCSWYDYQWHEDKYILIKWGARNPLYRIHVKMKPVNLKPDCDKPDEVARAYDYSRTRSMLDSYRAGY